MKSKLTRQAADNMVVFAYEQLRNSPCMRLGQIIMNHLNVEVAENLKWGVIQTSIIGKMMRKCWKCFIVNVWRVDYEHRI